MKLACFKAYDIRGRLSDELNEPIAYRIGRAYCEYLKPGSVVVGGDIRLSSEGLKCALVEGLRDGGADVIDLGMTGTEEIYFAVRHLKADGGIEVTASHNPIDYNGMKLVSKESRPIGADSGLRDIQYLTENAEFPERYASGRGKYLKHTVQEDYVDHLLGYINLSELSPMRLVVNAGNGAAGPVIDTIEQYFNDKSVPVSFIKINHQPDGRFPNGIPNPLLPENRGSTSNAVKEHGADMGIAWDGDFDRCFLFDERGEFIEGYYIVGLLAESLLEEHPDSKIIHDPRLTWNTIEQVSQAGGIPIQSKTGHAYIKEKMREEDAIYGGEMSAHHYFRDFGYCDSGMIPWLLVLQLLSRKKQSLSQLVKERMTAYPVSGEINVKLKDPDQAISSILNHYRGDQSLSVDFIDGISLSFKEWRFNLRLSNTEPLVRLNVESRNDPTLMRVKTAELMELLNQYR